MAVPQEELRNRGLALVNDGVGAAISVVEEPEQAAFPTIENAADTLRSPERRLKLTKIAIISGPSNSGKDAVVKLLAERHGWRIYDGTEDGFERRGTGAGGTIQREREKHLSFDARQAQMFAEAKPGDEMWIHQTRLGGIIKAAQVDIRNRDLGKQNWKMQGIDVEDPIQPIPAESILLWATKRVRQSRAVKQEQSLSEENRLPIPSRDSIIAELTRKEKNEVKGWAPRYKNIRIRPNPFSRHLKRRNGQPVYDKFVDTSKLTIEQTADRIEELLLQTGAAEIIQEPQIIVEMQPNKEFDLNDQGHGEPMTYGGTSLSQAPIMDIPKPKPTLEPA